MRKKIIFLLTYLFAGSVFAAQSPFSGDLKAGSYAPGFQVIEKYDYSRPYMRKIDYAGKLASGERARPIQINVWYPAKSTQKAAMTLADYVHLIATEDLSKLTPPGKEQSENRFLQGRWFQGYPEDKRKELLSKPANAVRDAEHAEGRFPLVVIANSGSLSSPFSHFVLAEYLASHGYIVASVPSRGAQTPSMGSRDSTVQLQDLQFLIGSLHDYPSIDRDKLALIGFGVGGLSTALLAMHNTDVDALVSLDSFLGNRFGYSLLFQNSLYKPNQLIVPVLHITAQETNEDTDFVFFKASKFSPAQYVKLKGLTPPDFSSIGMLKAMLPPPKDAPVVDTKRGYQTLCNYIHHFLNANLKKDSASKDFLGKKGIDDFVLVEFKEAVKAPPTEEQFAQIVREQGTEKAAQIQKEFSALIPDYRFYDPDILFPIAAEYAAAKKTKEAVDVLNLCLEAFPDNWECYDLIGRIHMNSGNKQQAIENLTRSLDLNPDNPESAEMLKKLKES